MDKSSVEKYLEDHRIKESSTGLGAGPVYTYDNVKACILDGKESWYEDENRSILFLGGKAWFTFAE